MTVPAHTQKTGAGGAQPPNTIHKPSDVAAPATAPPTAYKPTRRGRVRSSCLMAATIGWHGPG